ncbi:hypothetical protein BC943DRAFT_228785 [Umbelopsis sp. AD052]|nr:hypothetical protein BC943DRAFT_228785 [Umbelopsis sp. AD052]
MSLPTEVPSPVRPKVPNDIEGANLIRKESRPATVKSSEPQLTILRIKRKRNEEPLEALLVQQEAERQNNRGQRKIRKNIETNDKVPVVPRLFRLAETVGEQSFKNINEARKLKERISRRIQPGSRPMTPDVESRKEQRVEKQQVDARTARYRVIQQNRRKKEEPAGPPQVESAADKLSADLFQLYDAVKEKDSNANILLEDEAEDDLVMCNFISMVKEYLTVEERDEEAKKFSQTPVDDDDGYVYDVYYRDDTAVKSAFPSHNIGALIWADEQLELMNDDSDDSDVGDSEDEDSNAEDFYQNDYPEEEDYDDVLDEYASSEQLSSDDDYGY